MGLRPERAPAAGGLSGHRHHDALHDEQRRRLARSTTRATGRATSRSTSARAPSTASRARSTGRSPTRTSPRSTTRTTRSTASPAASATRPTRTASRPSATPRSCPGKLGLKYAKASRDLGWHWWPSDNAVITVPRENREADQAMGNELSGSPTGSLSTPANAHWPYAIRYGADLRTMARVETINAEGGRATGATYVDRTTGERHEVRAKIVVLAANGIGSPRLLLQSAQKGHPDGLANANGIVGKYLMHHVFAFCDSWFDEPVEGFKGSFGAPLYSHEFYHTDVSRGFVNGFGMQVARSFGPALRRDGHAHRLHGAVGREAPRVLRRPLRQPPHGLHVRRGPAGGDEPRHARPGRHGLVGPAGRARRLRARTPTTSRSRSTASRRSSRPPGRSVRSRPTTPACSTRRRAGTSWAPAGWATPPTTRCSTSGARPGTCRTCSSSTAAR